MDALHLSLKERALYWRTRAKICYILEGDENTKFFHTSATCRMRRNSIPSLLVDGVESTDHDSKATILKNFYLDLLGTVTPTAWDFCLEDLYPNAPRLSPHYSAPFTEAEIKAAFMSMNKLSSPGPDGFGPAFFSTFWATVAPDVCELFHSFYEGTIDLSRINRAFLVLLPKIEAASHPSQFRPISLQNCVMKAITKVLTSRLQTVIQTLVDADQTGFLSGRRISENIVYAADLLRCCHVRKAPTIVFKIDFRKAFDSVNWESLLTILRARGFDERWCLWMEHILRSGLTAVLLNGIPGDWIKCRNGLRQGDPLSPYLFILVADVLQRLIHEAWGLGALEHPLSADTPCPVLQYADDTLILCKATPEAAATLKKEGGFGIKDLHRQNRCLLLNFIHALYTPNPLPWKRWFFSVTGRDLGETSKSPSFLERIVDECLPLYRDITQVEVADGRTTSFWLDKWQPGPPLAVRFPALFSHSTRRHATVATVAADGLDLQARLSSAAEGELLEVLRIISASSPRTGHDRRFIDSPSSPRFTSREAYIMLSPARPRDQSACVAWSLRLPRKLKIFTYLADIDRLSTRANLFHKSCAPSALCASCPDIETRRHLFFDCLVAAEVWSRLDVPIPTGRFSVWAIRGPADFSPDSWHMGVAALLWSIWKARNSLVFRDERSPARLILLRAGEELSLWRWRLLVRDRADIDALRSFFMTRAR
ncbi:hypothetical protein QYE76_036954 [Lolium multiflorum]|uniref:Reverse transcriptase domain-containing protein n=1 Tax=Lolium multiflorum TaxID=4521 RepID=A0AAD8VPV2_LOLMU|nr:hypothetical protein QYE76_036954 [Lolium multiflorum]